jgi:OOP family OmpA-OmpF porin
MKSRLVLLTSGFLGLALVSAEPQTVPPDKQGCRDSPLLSRVSGCYIDRCERNDWEAVKVAVAPGKDDTIEGEYEQLLYYCPVNYSGLKVVRNAEAALRQAGYTIVFSGTYDGDPAATARKGSQWVFVFTGSGRYWVRTVNAKAMAQEMQAGAEAWSKNLAESGHAAIYGIYFDTDKAEIKPESEIALKEMAKLLNGNPKLAVFIVGHTDSTGEYLHNVKLSGARANAVVAALVTRHGIAAGRLEALGAGPIAPVASNRAEEGRAKNRRVELVER